MRLYKYLIKTRYLIAITLLCAMSNLSVVHADSSYDVVVHVTDATSAEVKITYPVSSGISTISALSSKRDGPILDGHRELISANAQDGSVRTITNDTPTTDAQITVQPGDQKITLTYRLTNVLKSTDVSLFNFLLFLGTTYPTTAHVKIVSPTGFEVLSYSTGPNSQVAVDGSISVDINADQSSTLLSAKGLTFLVYPKSSSYYVKKKVGDFTIIGSQNKVDQVSPVVGEMTYVRGMFSKLFGATLPNNIDLVIVPIRGQNSYYEAAGISLSPNIILVDPDDLLFNVGPNDPAKTIIHELGHLALANKNIFSNQLYYARWLDEGLAVFGEEYATDNYIIKTDKDRQIDTVLSSIKKMTLDELKTEYTVSFDYNFSANTKAQPINRTYAHAGLVMYNLYLQDATIIPRLLNTLKNNSGNITCKDCDTNTALNIIQNLSGLQRDEIIYPFKNSLTSTNQTLTQLTIQDVDQIARQNIQQSTSQKVGSYINKHAPVEQFTIPSNKVPESKEIATTTVKKDNVKQDIATSTNLIDDVKIVQRDTSISLFEKIRRWIMNLF